MDKLEIRTEDRENYVLLTLRGILDQESCPRLGKQLQECIDLFGLITLPTPDFKVLCDQITKRVRAESKGEIVFVRPPLSHYNDLIRIGLLTDFMWFVDLDDADFYISRAYRKK